MAKFNLRVSTKHIQIDKANTLILVSTAITTVIVVFCLVATQALLKQMSYQNKVIGLRSTASKQLGNNVKSVTALKTSFEAFENSNESVIGTKDKNSKIVLDALPSKYDFPALATSLEGLITASGSSVTGITGTDDEAKATQNSANPTAIEIPFSIASQGSFASTQKLIENLQRSIRPFVINSLTLSGSDSQIQATVTAKTYYQPEKKLEVQQKVVAGPNGTVKVTTTKKAATK
jgi:hypothetical protein